MPILSYNVSYNINDKKNMLVKWFLYKTSSLLIGFIFVAPFTLDHDRFKELIQKEVKRIEGELIEFAKYMRELKVRCLYSEI